jgi:hypothetical protein
MGSWHLTRKEGGSDISKFYTSDGGGVTLRHQMGKKGRLEKTEQKISNGQVIGMGRTLRKNRYISEDTVMDQNTNFCSSATRQVNISGQ